ncbi:MAG: PKD domain-containing protein [Haloplanus sp.]
MGIEVLNASDGTVVAANTTLGSTSGTATVTVPANTFSGDQSVTYRLNDTGGGGVLTTDTSLLTAGGGGGTSRMTIDSVTLSKTSVAPGAYFDVNVVVNNTGSASGTTNVKVFDVGTTDTIDELANRSVSVPGGSTKTVTLTTSVPDAGLADLYTVAGAGFERSQVLVQPGNSLAVTGFSVSKTTVDENEDLDVTATVSNTGNAEGWILVPIYHDGAVTQVKNVTVPANDAKQETVATTFATAGSHTLHVGGQPTTSITVESRGAPSVVDSSVRVVGGTQPTGTVVAGTQVSNDKLDVRLKAQGVQNGEADLANVGADETTRFEVELELKNFTPRMMMGTGGNVSWSVGPGPTADTANLTLTLEPREAQRFYYDDGTEPTYSNWPSEETQATTSRQAQAMFSFYNMQNAPVRFRTTLTGGTIVTDAQSFSPPMYRQGSNTQKPHLTVKVAGPHRSVDGTRNDGHYEAMVPDGMLDEWGVTSAGQLRAAYAGSQTQATFTRTSKGIEMKFDIHYSANSVEIRPGDTDTTAPSANAGSDATVTAGDSVTFDASGTTDNVGIQSYEWDFDGDGTYETSTTSTSVTHTYASAGSVTATLRVTDGAGNVDTDTVTVTVESDSNGGGGGGGGAALTGPSVDVSTNGASASVGVTGASASDPVDVSFGSSPPTAGGVGLSSLSVAADGAFDLSVTVADDAASLPDGTETPPLPGDRTAGSRALGYVSVAHPSLDDSGISSADLTVTVDEATLDDRGVAPDDVVVYRYHDGSWTALDTRLAGSADGEDRFAVDSPGLSVFAVAARTPSFEVRNRAVSTADLAPGESARVTATVENVGTAAGTHAVELAVGGEVTATRTVDLDPGESVTVSFAVAPDDAGTYDVRVDGVSVGRLAVRAVTTAQATATATPTSTATATATTPQTATTSATATGTPTPTPGGGGKAPGFGTVVAVVALLAAGLLAGRR